MSELSLKNRCNNLHSSLVEQTREKTRDYKLKLISMCEMCIDILESNGYDVPFDYKINLTQTLSTMMEQFTHDTNQNISSIMSSFFADIVEYNGNPIKEEDTVDSL